MTAALRRRLLFLTVLACAVVFVFYQGLFRGGVFVYRDAAHFYYPLFEFIQSEWDSGRVPAWNPYEGFGKPLVAEASSSVFYPGKLVFFSPLSYDWDYRLYIVGHVVLAAAGAAYLARRWRRSPLAATLAGISYAFSGSVLMQYCNVIFLVGAAWLPFAIAATDRMLIRRTLWDAALFGAALALMTLGGDPQMAYNAVGLALLYAILLWRRDCHFSNLLWWNRRAVLFAGAAVIAFALAAVQVLPTLEYLRGTARAETTLSERFACDFKAGPEHLRHIYEFSVGPWRFTELLWPNFGGMEFPLNQRWMDAIPAEGRIWNPTLYMGILPAALAAWGLRFRRRNLRLRWMSWTAVLGLLAAMGWYGPGWILHELRIASGSDPGDWAISAPCGGLYWLMTVALPGYASFRYPAKLLVVAALGLSLTAAFGWDRLRVGPNRGFSRLLAGIAAASGVGIVVNLAVRPWWNDWLRRTPPNPLYGPLDVAGAADVMLWGMCQTLLIVGVCLVLLPAIRRGRMPAAVLLVLITVVDIITANRWIVAFGPAGLYEERGEPIAALLPSGDKTDGKSPPFPRVYRWRRWLPPSFRETSSEERLVQLFRWDRDSLYPKYSLSQRVGMIDVRGTMVSGSVADYLGRLVDETDGRIVSFAEPPPAETVVVPANRTVEGADRIDSPLEDVGVWRLRRFRPWIGLLTDEDDPSGKIVAPRQCTLVSFKPGRAVVDVVLDRPGTLVFTGFNTPDWRARVFTVHGRSQACLFHVGEIGRSVSLGRGSSRIVLQYSPKSLYGGMMLSMVGWGVLAVSAGWRYRKRLFG